jgi:DNA-binding response OmpR family regulator
MAILVFENNAVLANAIQQNLIAEGYDTLLIREPNEVPEDEAFWRGVELIVLDLMMGDADLPKEWRERSENGLITGFVIYENMVTDKTIPVLVLTGLKDETLLDRVRRGIGNCVILGKPIVYTQFLGEVRRATKKK